MTAHSSNLVEILCFVLISMTIADGNRVTSTSDSGVCFYGKTAERVLSILATGNHRTLFPPAQNHPKDCSDLKHKHKKSGVYKIYPDNIKPFNVYCDMKTDGGSWMVIQRRYNGKVDFFRGWKEYEDGFGSIDKEFWLGLSKISKLTLQDDYEIRFDLEDFKGNKAYATYSIFSVADASTNYKLHLSGYSGTAGDSMAYHNGKAFSTKDRDNDTHNSKNCAADYKGAWWYKSCHHVNINGLYVGNKVDDKGMRWYTFKGSQSMKTTSMMMRRTSNNN